MIQAKAAALTTFHEAVNVLEKTTEAAVALSESNIGIFHTGRQNRALFLFAKLIAHNMSLLAIIDCYNKAPKGAALLDHFSIASLTRTIIDASLMTMYISNPGLSRDEWNLRRYVLYLHELTNRKRFLAALKTKDEAFFSSYPMQKAARIQKIKQFAHSLKLPQEATIELTNGQKVFVHGARGAAREAGWDVTEFDFNQSYLSAFVHSHPVSFMRADEHRISFSDPSDAQLQLSRFMVSIAADYTERVVQHMALFSVPNSGDPLGQVDD